MRRTPIVLLAALLALVLPVVTGSAAETAEGEEAVHLILADALKTALKNNLDLISARKDPRIARLGVDIQLAPFDPIVGADLTGGKTKSDESFNEFDPTATPPETSQDYTVRDTPWNTDVNWKQRLKFGANYNIAYNYAKSNPSPTARVIGPGLTSVQDSESSQSGFTATFTMPLLRGLGKEVNTVDLVLARSNVDITREQLKLQAETTIQQVENAYWDLVAVQEALRVANESLKLAQDLYELNKKKVEVGTLAPIEITQAEAGVASRKEGVIVAETAVLNAEDNLRRLLATPKDDPSWSRRIVPEDRPDYQDRTVDVEGAITKALDNRPEMVNAHHQLINSELSERVAHNGVKHSLDLSANLVPYSLSKATEVGFIRTPAGAGNPSTTNFDSKALNWAVTLTYGYPIGNRAAKASYEIATLNREKSEVNVQNVEQTIRVDVRTAARNVTSGVQRVAAAKANTVLQRKTLEAEQKKFENGMSTSFQVLSIQTDLLNAEVSEIQAILDYTKSLADLERAQGTLLEARGLEIQEDQGGK